MLSDYFYQSIIKGYLSIIKKCRVNYFYPCLGLLTILRYSIQGLGYSNLSMLSGVMEMIARCGVSL